MHVLRPICDDDLPKLVTLARSIEGGLTTLPPDEGFLRDRIDDSLRAFSPRVHKPGSECYLFVLEDTATGEIVGTSGIAARVGGFDPFYSYEIRTERSTHAPLGIDKDVAVLHLKQIHTGPTEIGGLFLRADCRRGGLGRLLSLARFLFLAAFPRRFDSTVIAELRGYLDLQGRSPFWEAVGRKFFEHDFYTADLLSGLGNKQFIADLMPRHPIYVPLLPEAVQAAIGKVHHDALPALAMLRAEGFAATAEIDIFDAGPQLRAAVAEIHTVRGCKTAPVHAVVASLCASPPRLVASRTLDFRCALGCLLENPDGTVDLGAELAATLAVKSGDTIVYVSARS